jgi:hypothetical protein
MGCAIFALVATCSGGEREISKRDIADSVDSVDSFERRKAMLVLILESCAGGDCGSSKTLEGGV